MNKTTLKKPILVSLSVAAIFATGCAEPDSGAHGTAPAPAVAAPEGSPKAIAPKSAATALEGSWNGRDVTPDHEAAASLSISGETLEFHGAEADDWAKGTFTLKEDVDPKQFVATITDCPDPKQIGKKRYAIYKIEAGTLTIAGSAMGASSFPASFDASDAHKLVFKHVQ